MFTRLYVEVPFGRCVTGSVFSRPSARITSVLVKAKVCSEPATITKVTRSPESGAVPNLIPTLFGLSYVLSVLKISEIAGIPLTYTAEVRFVIQGARVTNSSVAPFPSK